MYSQKETIRLGMPLSAVVFAQTVLAALWWKLLGVI